MDDYSFLPRGADVPAEADFCLVLDSVLMEPLIKKGEMIYVSRSQTPGDMEVGLFRYRGQLLCRQFCQDYGGNLHLLCANPLHEKDNICLSGKEQDKLLCLGRVLLKKKPGMPVYV